MDELEIKNTKDKLINSGGIVTDREIPIALLGISGVVVISGYDIRKFFERRFKKKYGNSALIYKHMKNIGTISLDGLIPVRYEKDGKKRWHYYDVKI